MNAGADQCRVSKCSGSMAVPDGLNDDCKLETSRLNCSEAFGLSHFTGRWFQFFRTSISANNRRSAGEFFIPMRMANIRTMAAMVVVTTNKTKTVTISRKPSAGPWATASRRSLYSDNVLT